MSRGPTTIPDGDDDVDDAPDSLMIAIARAPAISPGLAIGEVIDETFRIEGRLGAGGMGVVYLAHDLRLNRQVAVKLHAGSVSLAARTQREAEVMARLSHTNVATVYEVGTWQGRTFIAMEYLDGGTLRRWLEDRPRTWREILTVFVRAGQGLAAAHEAGLVHRDFKPDNVLLGRDGRVRVADFGIARVEADPPSGNLAEGTTAPITGERLTATGTRLGTPHYMSPEALRGAAVDARSDQYAFCIALREALEERRAPRWLGRIVARGLLDDPERRWPSMTAMIATIERARRNRRLALAGLATSVVASSALLVAWRLGATPAPPDRRCTGAAERLHDAWSPARSLQLRQALAAVTPDGDAVIAGLDRYGDDWVQMHRSACEATTVQGEQSEALLDLRMSCLDRRRAQLAATVDLMTTDAQAAQRGRDAVQALPRVAHCGDLELLRRTTPLPDDPGLAAEVATIQGELGFAQARWWAGQFSEASVAVEALLPRARAADWPPLTAEVAFELGRVRHELGGDGDPLFLEAAAAALEGGHDRAAISAYLALLHNSEGKPAAQWLALAEAAQARTHDDELAVEILIGQIALMRERNELAAAEAAARRAIDLATAIDGGEGLAGIAQTWLGTIQLQAGRPADARTTLVEALARLEGYFSADAFEVQQNRMWLVATHLQLGEHDAAVALAKSALDRIEHLQGRQTATTANYLTMLGESLLGHGDLDDAMVLLDRALAIAQSTIEPSGATLGHILGTKASIEHRRGNRDDAREHARAALAAYQQAYGVDSPNVVYPMVVAGIMERDSDHLDDGAATLEAALALAERVEVSDMIRANAALDLGIVRLLQDRPADALPLLEDAVRRCPPTLNPMIAANAQFMLAKALWRTGDRRRARTLAATARDGFAQLGAGFAFLRDDVAGWLADPG